MFSFAQFLHSFIDHSSVSVVQSACTRSDPPVFLFFVTSDDTFLLNEIIVRRLFHTHTDHARVYCLRTACAQGVLSATPNVVRDSSDRMGERRAGDAGLDQRLANPSERTAKFHEMVHPLLTIWLGRCPDGGGYRSREGRMQHRFFPPFPSLFSFPQFEGWLTFMRAAAEKRCFLFEILISRGGWSDIGWYRAEQRAVVNLKSNFFR